MKANINLRGVSEPIISRLKLEAKNQKTSVNSLILLVLERGLGLSQQHTQPEYHDLDRFCGCWSQEDLKEFRKATTGFEKIDKELWS